MDQVEARRMKEESAVWKRWAVLFLLATGLGALVLFWWTDRRAPMPARGEWIKEEVVAQHGLPGVAVWRPEKPLELSLDGGRGGWPGGGALDGMLSYLNAILRSEGDWMSVRPFTVGCSGRPFEGVPGFSVNFRKQKEALAQGVTVHGLIVLSPDAEYVAVIHTYAVDPEQTWRGFYLKRSTDENYSVIPDLVMCNPVAKRVSQLQCFQAEASRPVWSGVEQERWFMTDEWQLVPHT